MAVDLKQIEINRIIPHLIFKREDNNSIVEPKYSNEVVALDRYGKLVLQQRISDAIGSSSNSVNMSINRSDRGSLFEVIGNITCDGGCLIENSKVVARKLAEAQTKTTLPGGALIVFDGKIGRERREFIGIIKAEKHNGFTLTEDNNGLMLAFLDDLIMTPQQKLYKIGIFIKSRDGSTDAIPEDFDVVVYDSNMTRSQTHTAAKYFYDSFLGCEHLASSKRMTQDFYNHTRNFIQNHDEFSTEDKIELSRALHAYLKIDQRTNVNIVDFANDYFPTEEIRDEYTGFLRMKNLTVNSFNKDISLIEKKMKIKKWNFSNKVEIKAPSEDFEDNIKIIEETDEKTVLEIMGKLRSM